MTYRNKYRGVRHMMAQLIVAGDSVQIEKIEKRHPQESQ